MSENHIGVDSVACRASFATHKDIGMHILFEKRQKEYAKKFSQIESRVNLTIRCARFAEMLMRNVNKNVNKNMKLII